MDSFTDLVPAGEQPPEDDEEVLALLLGECIEEVCKRVSNASREEFLGDALRIDRPKPSDNNTAVPSKNGSPTRDSFQLEQQLLLENANQEYFCLVCHKSAHCAICNISFSSDTQHKEHNEGRKHKQMVQQALEQGMTSLPPVEKPFVCTVCRRNFYCTVCQKPFCSAMQMEDHIRGRKHKKLVMKLQAQGQLPAQITVSPETAAAMMGPKPTVVQANAAPADPAAPSAQMKNLNVNSNGKDRAGSGEHSNNSSRERKQRKEPRKTSRFATGFSSYAQDDEALYCHLCDVTFATEAQKKEHDLGRKHYLYPKSKHGRQHFDRRSGDSFERRAPQQNQYFVPFATPADGYSMGTAPIDYFHSAYPYPMLYSSFVQRHPTMVEPHPAPPPPAKSSPFFNGAIPPPVPPPDMAFQYASFSPPPVRRSATSSEAPTTEAPEEPASTSSD